MKQQQYKVGIYVRLSKEDSRAGESLSIENQKLILQKHVEEQPSWTLEKVYVDDDYGGTNFDRPGVKQLIADVENGKINLVLCKDLSRFGRNYIQVGQYIDYFFPLHNTRFIALSDGVDTIDKDSANLDMMPLLNIFNEWHCKNTSKKIRTVKEANAKAGKYQSTKAPYGYIKGTCDKKLPVIDPPAAAIVRRIFEMRSQGMSPHHIADILNLEGVPIPSDYEAQRTGKPNPRKTNHHWSHGTIKPLLANPAYVGDLAQCRTTSVSYKNKKVVFRDESEWVVISDTHEPIISRETWAKVQEVTASVSQGKRTKQGEILPMSGLMLCMDCGYKMKLHRTFYLKDKKNNPHKVISHSYNCNNYTGSRKFCCSNHYINLKAIHKIVVDDIRAKATLILKNEEKARKSFLKNKAQVTDKQKAISQNDLLRSEKRIVELDGLMQAVYEDKINSKIPEDVCINLLEKYKAEHGKLSERVQVLRHELEQQSQDESDIDEFIRRIKKFVDIEELDRATALELIDHVKIGKANVEEREIRIYYKLLGDSA
jgi:DNA invertase Pin-like site-specific DNA recombinase